MFAADDALWREQRRASNAPRPPLNITILNTALPRHHASSMKIATSPPAAVNHAATASKLKLDSLFLQWFSMPDTQRLVSSRGADCDLC
jgi:hypothetical protein